MAATKTQGTTLHISNENADSTAYASATFAKVGSTRSISNPDGEASEIDTTHLESAAKEFIMGLPDNGKFTATAISVPADLGQIECLDARNLQQARWVKITGSGGRVAYFKAFVMRWSDIGADPDGVVMAEGSFRISGAITYV